MTATTALTAQNTLGVYGIHQVPPAFLKQQIDACVDDIGVDVVKTGMLASTEAIEVVAASLATWNERRRRMIRSEEGESVAGGEGEGAGAALRLVLDPVMIATTGAALLPSSALRALRERLFPLATVVTPNVPEARLLLKDALDSGDFGNDFSFTWPVEGVEDLESMARTLLSLGDAAAGKGPQWVLVKGGHTPFRRKDYKVASIDEEKQVVVDVLVGREEPGGDVEVVRIETEWMESRNTHGTGCSLACEWSFFPLFKSVRKRKGETDCTCRMQLPSPRTWQRAWTSHKLSGSHAVMFGLVSKPRLDLAEAVGL